jgi:antitoxin ParD1/3/4
LVTLKKKLIMNRNTSISLGSYFDKFVQGRISAGRFNNASEVIRAGLRLLEDEENKIIVLREAIKEGIESGIAGNFNPDRHLRMMKAKKNG